MYLPEKFLNKKIIVIFILILVAGGIFYWQYANKEIKGSPDDYEIIETTEGIFVENKKAGLFVKAPDGWDVKKMEIGEGSILIHTFDIEGEKKNEIVALPLTKGCGIEISVAYKKMNFEEIKEKVKMLHWGIQIKFEEFEEIVINNYYALKNTFDSDVLGPAVVIYIPKGNKLYDFGLYFESDEKEKCVQEFNNFLETVSIYSD